MFGEALRRLRLSRNMTQKDLAKALGVSLRTIQNYESGTLPKEVKMLQRIAAFFDVPISELAAPQDYYKLAQMERREARKQAVESDSAELYAILRDLTSLFAGGNLSRNDKALFLEAVEKLYREAQNL